MSETGRKIAAVTGGNRGIGFEVCRQLGKLGYTVILGARDLSKGRDATGRLREAGCDVHARAVDVANEESCRAFIDGIEKEFGRIDALVNNAGVFLDKNYGALDVPLETVRQTFEVNSLGPLRLMQLTAPIMKKNGYGRIVNISSTMGQLSEMGAGYLSYRVSKTALNSLTAIFANQFKGTGVLINCMCPGWVKTDMGGENAPKTTEQGAETAIFLATLPDNGPTGRFFSDKKEIPW